MGTIFTIIIILILVLPIIAPSFFGHTSQNTPPEKRARRFYSYVNSESSMSLSIGNMRPH
ncbi:hypothetical protein [Nitrospirillum amazonense]|uniref:hypothetical protein n=1 Tax=Nitrospirillum amazonense TaxID=28077 RepID=UPI002412702A|nr:hypothetical protein [Nitrospirillum amazonense]MDG3443705.1 hypothetical protein [Nitrospirillum amazonense]